MKTYTKAERKAALKMIDEYFFRLERVCESTDKWNRYMEIHQQEEKNHGRFTPDFVKPGLTKKQSIRLFAVKEILEHVAGKAFPVKAEDFFTIKQSVFGAAAMYCAKRASINDTFSPEESRSFLETVDYAALNQEKEQPANR